MLAASCQLRSAQQQNPHNDCFDQVISRKDQAKTCFARYLPKPIRAIANLEALTLMASKPVSDAGVSLYKVLL